MTTNSTGTVGDPLGEAAINAAKEIAHRTWQSLLGIGIASVILGLIVLIRTILSWSIQIEIEGVLPWKRALLESGGSLMVKQIKADHELQVAYNDRPEGSAG